MRRILAVVSLTLAATSVAAPADAQFRFRGVEFWGGQYAWSGDQVDALDAGFRGGFAVYGELSPRIGVGIEGVTGGFDSNVGDAGERIRWDDGGLNSMLRVALGNRAGIHPFVEARFGWTRISTTVPAGEGNVLVVQEDGISYGGEVGVEVPLNQRARIVVAGGLTRRDYGGAELEGTEIPGTEFAANRWGVRFGIAIGRSVE